jgi:hypothetical protein
MRVATVLILSFVLRYLLILTVAYRSNPPTGTFALQKFLAGDTAAAHLARIGKTHDALDTGSRCHYSARPS